MRAIVAAVLLLGAGTSFADELAEQSVRDALIMNWNTLDRVYAAPDAAITDPHEAPIGDGRVGRNPQPAYLLWRTEKRFLLGLRSSTGRLAVWVDRLQHVVSRHVGVSTKSGAAGPTAGAEGIYLEPGARVAFAERQEEWVKIETTGAIAVKGWIPADAYSLSFQPREPQQAVEVREVSAGTVVSRRGAVLARVRGDAIVRTFANHRDEVCAEGVCVVGKWRPGSRSESGESPILGGVVGGSLHGGEQHLPDGACLFSTGGAVVGRVESGGSRLTFGDRMHSYELDAKLIYEPKRKGVGWEMCVTGSTLGQP